MVDEGFWVLSNPAVETLLPNLIVVDAIDILLLVPGRRLEGISQRVLSKVSLSHAWDSNREDHNDLLSLGWN